MEISGLTPQEVRKWPHADRIQYLDTDPIQVNYPRSTAIMNKIARFHRKGGKGNEPICFKLVGEYGVGKTRIVENYHRKYPVEYIHERTIRRVVMVIIPGKASLMNMLTSFLIGLGDPDADSGSIGNKGIRITNYIRDQETQLVFFDEIPHFVDADRNVVLNEALNVLKGILKATKIACGFVGNPKEVEMVVNSNPQLWSLFKPRLLLEPFRWDHARPKLDFAHSSSIAQGRDKRIE